VDGDRKLAKFRRLWWDEGNFHPDADWEEAKLPYVLAEGVTLEEYEVRTEKFNICGLWEWSDGKVIIYELPSDIHEICKAEISARLNSQFDSVRRSDAMIIGTASTRFRTNGESRRSGKEADLSFRPKKRAVTPPYGSDGDDKPWPNLVVEVAYSESEDHVLDKVKNYWLSPGRAHDAIAVKAYPVPEGTVPSRMKAWHFCVSDRRTRGIFPARTEFEFGGNIEEGDCVINIQLDCLYNDARSRIRIPRHILPDLIVLDF